MGQGLCSVILDLPILCLDGLRRIWGNRAAGAGGSSYPGGAAVAGILRPAWRGLREGERRRLAQDLHDEIGHDLIVLKLYTEVIALDLKKGDISQLRRKLKESVTLIKHALKSVRHLTFDLGPAIWNEQGFVPAVRLYARQFAKRTGIRSGLTPPGCMLTCPRAARQPCTKCWQGALSNVVAHADAHNVKITLANGRDSVTMRIEDDGRGFDVGRKLGVPRQSYGLRAMRDRVEFFLGGAIHFASRPARLPVGESRHHYRSPSAGAG